MLSLNYVEIVDIEYGDSPLSDMQWHTVIYSQYMHSPDSV